MVAWNAAVEQATAASNAALPSDAQVLGAVNRAIGADDVVVCAAGGLGVKLATPERAVYVLVGDGSYLMMNSEIATSVQLGLKLIVVVLDNGGFGCIERLQQGTGGASFNNLFPAGSGVDFAAHAASLGALACRVSGIAALEAALAEARAATRTTVIVIATDPVAATREGGAWWDVAVPAVSARPEVTAARAAYEAAKKRQKGSG